MITAEERRQERVRRKMEAKAAYAFFAVLAPDTRVTLRLRDGRAYNGAINFVAPEEVSIVAYQLGTPRLESFGVKYSDIAPESMHVVQKE